MSENLRLPMAFPCQRSQLMLLVLEVPPDVPPPVWGPQVLKVTLKRASLDISALKKFQIKKLGRNERSVSYRAVLARKLSRANFRLL